MVNADQIRERLNDYLANNISFEQFEDWLIDQSMVMHLESPQDAQELILDIKEAIAPYLDKIISESRLKADLRRFVDSYDLHGVFQAAQASAPRRTSYSASSQTVPIRRRLSQR